MHRWNADDSVVQHAAAAPQPDWSVRYARLAAYTVYAVTILSGLMVGAVPGQATQVLAMIGIVWSMSYFCALDARAHNRVFVQSFWRLSSMAWPISILCHLVRVRGKRGALAFALHGMLLVFCAATSVAIGSLLKR